MMIRVEFVASVLFAAALLGACGSSETTPARGTDPATSTTTTSSTSGTSEHAGTSSGPTPQTSSTRGSPDGTAGSSGPGTPAGFLNPLDIPEMHECTIWAENCEDGEKCMPVANDGGNAWNDWACRPVVPNPDSIGESCTLTQGTGADGYDTCELHAMCWDLDDRGEGSCVGLCAGDWENPACLEPDAVCSFGGDGYLALCIPTCNPLLQPCPAGDGCYPTGSGYVCAPDASGEGMGEEGDPCEFTNGCTAGLYCGVGECGDSPRCCLPFCDLDQPECPAGTECVPGFSEGVPPPVGSESVGRCATLEE